MPASHEERSARAARMSCQSGGAARQEELPARRSGQPALLEEFWELKEMAMRDMRL